MSRSNRTDRAVDLSAPPDFSFFAFFLLDSIWPSLRSAKHLIRSSIYSCVSVTSRKSIPGTHMVKLSDRMSFSMESVRFASTSSRRRRSRVPSSATLLKSLTLSGVTSCLTNLRMRFCCFAIETVSSFYLIRLLILALATESQSFEEPSTKPFLADLSPSLIFWSSSIMENSLYCACVRSVSVSCPLNAIGIRLVRHWETWAELRQWRKMLGAAAIYDMLKERIAPRRWSSLSGAASSPKCSCTIGDIN